MSQESNRKHYCYFVCRNERFFTSQDLLSTIKLKEYIAEFDLIDERSERNRYYRSTKHDDIVHEQYKLSNVEKLIPLEDKLYDYVSKNTTYNKFLLFYYLNQDNTFDYVVSNNLTWKDIVKDKSIDLINKIKDQYSFLLSYYNFVEIFNEVKFDSIKDEELSNFLKDCLKNKELVIDFIRSSNGHILENGDKKAIYNAKFLVKFNLIDIDENVVKNIVKYNHYKLFFRLINEDIVDYSSYETPLLRIAIKNNNVELSKYLLSNNISLISEEIEEFLFMLCERYWSTDLIEILFARYYIPNISRLIEVSKENNCDKVVRFLQTVK